ARSRARTWSGTGASRPRRKRTPLGARRSWTDPQHGFEREPRLPQFRERRPPAEDIVPRVLDEVEDAHPAAGEEAHVEARRAAQAVRKRQAPLEHRAGPRALDLHQLAKT